MDAEFPPQPTKLRVLFVVDSLYWVTALIARQIARYNPWIDATLCSGTILQKVMDRCGGQYPGSIDLVHFLTPHEASKFIDRFNHRLPCVVTIHHVEDERSVRPEPQAHAIMTVCRQWHDYLISSGVDPAKLVLLHNGVETDLFRPPTPAERKRLRSHLGIRGDDLVVGFSAKRTSDTQGRKGIGVFVRAITQLRSRVRSVVLALVGPGWDDVITQLADGGVRCVYRPFILDRRKLAQFYRLLDVFWVTARIEGGPVPLLEAMSSGVCCVTTPVGIAREAVENGANTFLAPVDDVDAFVSETEHLAGDGGLRRCMGLAARQTIVENYTWARTSQSAHRLYGVAMERFCEQTPGACFGAIPAVGAASDRSRGDYLASLPRWIRPWVKAEEHLVFARDLIDMGARTAARRVALRALARCPLDIHVWRGVYSTLARDSTLRCRSDVAGG